MFQNDHETMEQNEDESQRTMHQSTWLAVGPL